MVETGEVVSWVTVLPVTSLAVLEPEANDVDVLERSVVMPLTMVEPLMVELIALDGEIREVEEDEDMMVCDAVVEGADD